MPGQDYTVPATTRAEREEMDRARVEALARANRTKREIQEHEANTAPVDQPTQTAQAEESFTNYVSASEEIPYLMELIVTLIREKAQLQATCMKLLREKNLGSP